jgi:predicted Zn-dependent protease with MMP-like domain
MARPRLSFREFVRAARRAVAELPEAFRNRFVNLAIDVREEPFRAALEGAEEGMETYGFFEGAFQTDLVEGIPSPRRIWIFKGPIERASRHRDEVILHIQETVVHEVAHYFGFEEEDLDAFEAAMDERRQRLFGHLDKPGTEPGEWKSDSGQETPEGRD